MPPDLDYRSVLGDQGAVFHHRHARQSDPGQRLHGRTVRAVDRRGRAADGRHRPAPSARATSAHPRATGPWKARQIPSSGRLVNLEGLYDWVFAGAGVRVFVTDYVMGTPGMHTHEPRRAGPRHARRRRAARNLSGGSKVAFYGHSQGGGASAAAVGEAANYAPDLQVAAATPRPRRPTSTRCQRNIDGSDLVGAIGFTINGLAARYLQLAPIMDANMSERGKRPLEDLSTMCTDQITSTYGHQRTSE